MNGQSFQLPANSLPPQAPPGARLQRIDFGTTDPPLEEYKDLFAAVIDNILTESECQDLIKTAEASTVTDGSNEPTWERAMVNAGGGRQIMATYARNCGRIIHDSPVIAQKLLERIQPFLAECGINTIANQARVTGLGPARRGEVFHLSRLNERLRFLRYEGGEYFRPHCDGMYETPNGKEVSLFTIHLYLNGDGEQDRRELAAAVAKAPPAEAWGTTPPINQDLSGPLLGGATSFQPSFSNEPAVRIFPKTGSVLIFQHNNLWHAGDDVFRGVKYTLRTDIMYRRSGGD